jgi:rare lipoprotein A
MAGVVALSGMEKGLGKGGGKKRIFVLAVMGGALLLAGCSSSSDKLDPFAGTGSPKYAKSGPLPKGGGRRHVGKPYTVAGRTFYPTANPKPVQVGIASWYGPKFHRRKTSNGEWFDMYYLSAAHPTMPLPSYARVTNLENGRTVVVRVNDRGPFVGTRIMDLSMAAAERLGYKRKGKARVKVEYLGPAPLGDDRQLLAKLNRVKDAPKATLLAAIRGQDTGTMLASAAPSQPARAYAAPAGAEVVRDAAYVVQVASFVDRARAMALSRSIAPYGPARVVPADVNGMTYWRVQMGPFPNPAAADAAQRAVAQAGIYDARVITVQATSG